MESLADKRLVIVVGKGGVGKTTTSCAIALEMARRGRSTLLVTVDPAKRLEDALGVPVGFTETRVAPRLWAMMLDPETVIREHLAERVPQAQVTQHPLFRYVTGSMPGLNELMAIGRLNDLRKEQKYDVIVVDTAPTGHALSFLSAPQAIEELLSERSMVAWAVKAYTVYQRLSGAARSFGSLFRSLGPKLPDIDFEKIFAEMQEEANAIRKFLCDPTHSAMVAVTVPEKLPVEETIDLHAAVVKLGMSFSRIVVNKVQPDPVEDHHALLDELITTASRRRAFARQAAAATQQPAGFFEGLLESASFGRIRRAMNLEWIADLRRRLPDVPLVVMPLFREDIEGLRKLGTYRAALFPDAVAPDASA